MDLNGDFDSKDVYFSYLLRIWGADASEGLSSPKEILWRFSLESTRTRERIVFKSLKELYDFLQTQFTVGDDISNGSKDKPTQENVRV